MPMINGRWQQSWSPPQRWTPLNTMVVRNPLGNISRQTLQPAGPANKNNKSNKILPMNNQNNKVVANPLAHISRNYQYGIDQGSVPTELIRTSNNAPHRTLKRNRGRRNLFNNNSGNQVGRFNTTKINNTNRRMNLRRFVTNTRFSNGSRPGNNINNSLPSSKCSY